MIDDQEIGYHRLAALSRFAREEFLGPVITVEKEKEEEEHMGYTLKLDLSKAEHDALVAWLKRGSYNPAIKKILYEIIGYDEAVEAAKKLAAQYEESYRIREEIENAGRPTNSGISDRRGAEHDSPAPSPGETPVCGNH